MVALERVLGGDNVIFVNTVAMVDVVVVDKVIVIFAIDFRSLLLDGRL